MLRYSFSHIEDCFENSNIYDVALNMEITEDFVITLGKFGSLQYFPNFPKPFFKLRLENLFELKGIVGSYKFRVRLINPSIFTLDDFLNFINDKLTQRVY